MLTISPKVNRTTFSGSGYENFNQSLNNCHAKGSLTNIAVQSNEQITRSPKKSFSLIEKLNPINLLTKEKNFFQDRKVDAGISQGLFFTLLAFPLVGLYTFLDNKFGKHNPKVSLKKNLLFSLITAPIIGAGFGLSAYIYTERKPKKP